MNARGARGFIPIAPRASGVACAGGKGSAAAPGSSLSAGARVLLIGASIALLAGACSGAAAPPAGPLGSAPSAGANYFFPSVGDDAPVSSETMRGRATALVFITTYDLASQLLARRLAEVITSFTPRANAAAVVVEPPAYAELLPAYREALSLPYPVVMADFATQRGAGPFGNISRVPVLIILDREGRQVSRHEGSVETRAIEAALRAALR